jgi:uncharacterized membrane protein YqjE
MSSSKPESGLFASLRGLLGTVFEMAQVRLDLLSTEIEQEKIRLVDGLLWAGLALMLLGIGLVLLCGFIVLMFAEGYRLAAVGVLTVVFLGGGAMLIRLARERLRNPGGMFGASVAELASDHASVLPGK